MADEDEEKQRLEMQLEGAVTARLQHFKDQADSLTLESVRRLLEKDLGLDKFSLDAHKRFIRHYLEKIMEAADETNADPITANMDKDEQTSMDEEKALRKQQDAKSDPKKSSPGKDETMEDSPIMGVLTAKSVVGTQSSLSESSIKQAILERADHLQANSETISLAGVRRLLEDDLGLDKNTLDAFKEFISQQVDEVLKGDKSVKDVKKKVSRGVKNRKLKKGSSEEDSDTSQCGSDSDEMGDKVKSRKEAAPKRNIKKSEQRKKRKISENADVFPKKPTKLSKRQKEEDNNSDEDGNLSEDNQSQSSGERSVLRKEKSAPVYGKRVENLKSIIKACGMSIPPAIYKKAKQAPDNKRETILVKELEGILTREGLSKNPSEKEIKDCRKRKERAKELEGIDMSNIISSSRRRSTFSFAAPEKPVVRGKKDKVDDKDSKKQENNDKDLNDDNEKEKEKEMEEEKEKDKEEEAEDEEEDGEEQDDEDESEEFDEDDNEESD
ncbi:DNA ligase 1-like [Salvia hispanica]|uniref:DNA ligase 1-like n=1 Tax=Salvia hispanica TaxID=49212 RepID=UPI002009CD24|nr:DNA ligase 1-like [Salvia hispanica]